MDRVVAQGWRLCAAAAVVVALAGCSAGVRKGMLDGYDHGYASPCGAAFIGYHGRVERCVDE
jgi:hypothetical protein